MGVSQILEKVYSELESEFAPEYESFIKRIKSSDDYLISGNDRISDGKFLVSQIDRTMEHREANSQFAHEFLTQLKEKGFSQDQIDQLGFNEKFLDKKSMHLESVLMGSEMREMLVKFLSEHIWIIFKNCTPSPYYTSDNPITKYGHIKDDLISNEGYISPGIEINFPITRDYLLVMCDREYFSNLEKIENKISMLEDKENIKYHNSLQVVSCYRQVFCISRNFEILDEIYNKSPTAFDLNRKRIG